MSYNNAYRILFNLGLLNRINKKENNPLTQPSADPLRLDRVDSSRSSSVADRAD